MDDTSETTGISFHAGFPNAAEGAPKQALSLDALVVRRPTSTFFWHLADDVPEAHFYRGDIITVDRSATPRLNDWIVVIINNDFVLARHKQKGRLQRANGAWLNEPAQFWGVVTYVVQPVRGRA